MNVVELQGPDTLVEGLELIMTGDPDAPDLVVLRDSLEAPVISQLQDCYRVNRLRPVAHDGERYIPVHNVGALTILSEVLDIDTATAVLSQRWQEVGYPEFDTTLTPEVYHMLRCGEFRPHVDFDVGPPEYPKFDVMATVNICTRGVKTVVAEKINRQFRMPDGTFDIERYRRFAAGVYYEPDDLRSRAQLSAGDIGMWSQNPHLTVHGSQDVSGSAEALLLEWHADWPSADRQ